jgi:hypothetical protein
VLWRLLVLVCFVVMAEKRRSSWRVVEVGYKMATEPSHARKSVLKQRTILCGFFCSAMTDESGGATAQKFFRKLFVEFVLDKSSTYKHN